LILGLSFSHNATVALVDETSGAILFCCSEERFSRRKNEWGIPKRTIEYVFKNLAKPREISAIAVGEAYNTHYASSEYAWLTNLANYAQRDAYVQGKARLMKVVLKEKILQCLGKRINCRDLIHKELSGLGLAAPVSYVPHHKAHAASAYYASPFEEALAITLDGEGDGLSGSCWHGRGAKLMHLRSIPELESIGLFYKSITALLGFRTNRDEGKVMGLAAQGNPDRYYKALQEFLSIIPEGNGRIIDSRAAQCHLGTLSRARVSLSKLSSTLPLLMKASHWDELLNAVFHQKFRELYADDLDIKPNEELPFQTTADIAAAAQKLLEEVTLALIKRLRGNLPAPNIALAGGIFSNVQLNQCIIRNNEIGETYIHPGMGDEGLALGAALLQHHDGKTNKSATPHTAFLGPSYRNEAVEEALSVSGREYQRLEQDALVERIAKALADHHVVGVFRGAMEYGPRALGNRSILANPASDRIGEQLNRRLKRSDFMPFAPAVLDSSFDEIFDDTAVDRARLSARFMTIALAVDTPWKNRIPGVVHVDGTARPQFVTEADNYFLHAVLKRFHALTGIGCLLNTSFNIHEEPIVNTPQEALSAAFVHGAVDMLAMENFLVHEVDVSNDSATDLQEPIAIGTPSRVTY
jgi:carbamoyltransferase